VSKNLTLATTENVRLLKPSVRQGIFGNRLSSVEKRNLPRDDDFINIVRPAALKRICEDPVQQGQAFTHQERSQLKEQFYNSFAIFDMELQRNYSKIQEYK
jgi:hypothetical protein